MKYAYKDELGWHIEVVDSGWRVGKYTSLALDITGAPHVSYWDEGMHALKYAHKGGMDWHHEKVDSAGWGGLYTSVALDVAGTPHISYMGYIDSPSLN